MFNNMLGQFVTAFEIMMLLCHQHSALPKTGRKETIMQLCLMQLCSSCSTTHSVAK